MESLPVHVAGAGIAGLAAALALSPHHDVVVLEQADTFSEVGAGLQLGANAMRALRKLGASDAVEPVTFSPPEIHMRDGVTGQLLKRLALGHAFEQRYGAPYRVAHRADLHAALLQVAKSRGNIETRAGQKVSRIEADGLGITLQAGGQHLKIQHLIAADGVNSLIRQSLFSQSTAIDSGEVFHRSLVPLPAIAGIAMECVNLWMVPGGHVVHYPVGQKGLLNLVAITPKGVTIPEQFRTSCQPLQHILGHLKVEASPWPGLYAPALHSWTRHGVLLLGDAAHATLPYLAQGAAMSLEDAATLATVLPTTHSLDNAFAETAARRIQRTTRLQQESLKVGKTYHASGITRLTRNMVLQQMPQRLVQAKLDWIYQN